MSIEPHAVTGETDAVCRGIEALRTRNLRWFSTHGIEDLSVDGPFVTGDHFALFADMLIVHAGQRTPHSQIAVFAVRDGKIIEERHFTNEASATKVASVQHGIRRSHERD